MEKTVNDKFVQWFEGPANPSDPSDKTLNYERIGYLVACNGCHFKVSQMGIIAIGGPFNAGLTTDEGMELIQVSNFISGAGLVDDTIWPYVTEKIKMWIENKLKERDEEHMESEDKNGSM